MPHEAGTKMVITATSKQCANVTVLNDTHHEAVLISIVTCVMKVKVRVARKQQE